MNLIDQAFCAPLPLLYVKPADFAVRLPASRIRDYQEPLGRSLEETALAEGTQVPPLVGRLYPAVTTDRVSV